MSDIDHNITPTDRALYKLREKAKRLDRKKVIAMALGNHEEEREAARERGLILVEIDSLLHRRRQDQARRARVAEYLGDHPLPHGAVKPPMHTEDAYALLYERAREAGYIRDTEEAGEIA